MTRKRKTKSPRGKTAPDAGSDKPGDGAVEPANDAIDVVEGMLEVASEAAREAEAAVEDVTGAPEEIVLSDEHALDSGSRAALPIDELARLLAAEGIADSVVAQVAPVEVVNVAIEEEPRAAGAPIAVVEVEIPLVAVEDPVDDVDTAAEGTDAEGAVAVAAEDGAVAVAESGDDGDAEVAGATLPTSAASMDAPQLKFLVEALVFASDKPITVQRLRQLTRVSDIARLEAALAELEVDYRERGLILTQVSGGFQFRTRTQYAGWVQQLVAGRPVRLSRAQLETLAIIAYRQPITRPEIDEIRGVDSSATLKLLLDRSLIRDLGKREEVGRPRLYGTTKEFLDFFSLGDLRELPTLREYSELSDESRRVMTDRLGALGIQADDGTDDDGGEDGGGGESGGVGGPSEDDLVRAYLDGEGAPAERSDALRTMIPAESVGRPVLGSSPRAPAPRKRSDTDLDLARTAADVEADLDDAATRVGRADTALGDDEHAGRADTAVGDDEEVGRVDAARGERADTDAGDEADHAGRADTSAGNDAGRADTAAGNDADSAGRADPAHADFDVPTIADGEVRASLDDVAARLTSRKDEAARFSCGPEVEDVVDALIDVVATSHAVDAALEDVAGANLRAAAVATVGREAHVEEPAMSGAIADAIIDAVAREGLEGVAARRIARLEREGNDDGVHEVLADGSGPEAIPLANTIPVTQSVIVAELDAGATEDASQALLDSAARGELGNVSDALSELVGASDAQAVADAALEEVAATLSELVGAPSARSDKGSQAE